MHAVLTMLTCFFSSFFSSWAQSQLHQQENNPLILVEAIISQVQSPKAVKVASDTIEGNCYFSGSNCNGARISLFDRDGNLIETQTLLSSNNPSFAFHKLKADQNYRIDVDYKRYEAKGELNRVKTGSYLQVDLFKKSEKLKTDL